jgi:diguanylate cyclase (GGDEF)-like protein/PAS domain S-box-containing protein
MSTTTERDELVLTTTAPAFDDLPVAALAFGPEGVVWVNQRWIALTGLTASESYGDGWLCAVHSDDRMTARRFALGALARDTVADWRVLGRDGRHSAWVQATSGRVSAGHSRAFVVALTEIDAHKVNEAGLLHRALHDSLTGLLNQSAFRARVVVAVQRTAAEFGMCAVLYLDLDHFKDVNDLYGHKCGDQLLVAVSKRLRASLRPSDAVGRLGGDEIGVLCPTLHGEHEAVRLAERIVNTINQPFTIDEHVVHISVSVGLAFSNGTGLTADELVAKADQALYRAKGAGRSQWATTTEADPGGAMQTSELHDVVGHVVAAQRGLGRLVGQLGPCEEACSQQVDASHALTRASRVLHADLRIG